MSKTVNSKEFTPNKEQIEDFKLVIKFRDAWLSKLRALNGLSKRTNNYKDIKGQMNAWSEAHIILCNFVSRKFGWIGCELDLKIEAYEKTVSNKDKSKQNPEMPDANMPKSTGSRVNPRIASGGSQDNSATLSIEKKESE